MATPRSVAVLLAVICAQLFVSFWEHMVQSNLHQSIRRSQPIIQCAHHIAGLAVHNRDTSRPSGQRAGCCRGTPFLWVGGV